MVIKHVHSGIKRLRMMRDKLRVCSDWFRDMVMVVACGPYNLRVRNLHRACLAREHANPDNRLAQALVGKEGLSHLNRHIK